MEYYLLLKVVVVIVLTDLMDLFNFKRRRNEGYFCIHSSRYFDGWHDTKKLLLLYVFGELVKWDIFLLVMAAAINLFIHELVLYHGLFDKFNNHKK